MKASSGEKRKKETKGQCDSAGIWFASLKSVKAADEPHTARCPDPVRGKCRTFWSKGETSKIGRQQAFCTRLSLQGRGERGGCAYFVFVVNGRCDALAGCHRGEVFVLGTR